MPPSNDSNEATPPSASDGEPPSTAIAAVKVKKQPPPESPDSIRIRRLVIFSFWAVVILLGLPVWWKTTEVYRADLPLRVMKDWAEGKVCQPVFPLPIAVVAPSLSTKDAQYLIQTIQDALAGHNRDTTHRLNLYLSRNDSRSAGTQGDHETAPERLQGSGSTIHEDNALTINLVPFNSGSSPSAELRAHLHVLDVFYGPDHIPSSSSPSSPLLPLIVDKLNDIFSEERAMLAHLLQSSPTWKEQFNALSPERVSSLERRQTRSFKYAPTYHLTFSLFSATAAPSAWEIDSALEAYLRPLLGPLSTISNFTIDTQVQLYANLSPSIQQPQYDAVAKQWTMRKEDLSGFVNAAEWPLSPSIGAGSTINFAVYVPAEERSPLGIEGDGGVSWLVPQWGGVMILNPPFAQGKRPSSIASLTKQDLEPAVLIFANQLMALLGLPDTPSSLALRLNTLVRYRAASLLLSASSTMGALARLTLALPSIAIPDTVAKAVDETIRHLNSACNSLHEGKFHRALEHAQIAEAEAEKAFFEPSMVGQVYFPEEHKVAVYLPLLGPVAVPLIMAALKEIRTYTRNRK